MLILLQIGKKYDKIYYCKKIINTPFTIYTIFIERGLTMNIHESAEDYLERILVLQKKNHKVISIDIANSMNYSKPSISRAMKNLKQAGYVTIDESGIIELTETGFAIASRIYERHLLLTEYFINLGVPEDIAKADACKVEHDLSNETFEAIKRHVQMSTKKQ